MTSDYWRYARIVRNALEVRGLEKRYGSVQALKGVDLDVGEGELFGLLGPNGAGKSTLVKIAVGLVRPTRGEAEIAGARAGSRAARGSLGYLAELFRFPGWYTADEVLELHQQLAGSTGGAGEGRRLLGLVGLSGGRGPSPGPLGRASLPPARRADLRTRPGRTAHRAAAARGAAKSGSLRPPQLAPALGDRARL